MTASFVGAACTGQVDLFDSRDWDDHRTARDICLTRCPRLEACRAEVDPDWAHGTWAGEMYGKRGARPMWLRAS